MPDEDSSPKILEDAEILIFLTNGLQACSHYTQRLHHHSVCGVQGLQGAQCASSGENYLSLQLYNERMAGVDLQSLHSLHVRLLP